MRSPRRFARLRGAARISPFPRPRRRRGFHQNLPSPKRASRPKARFSEAEGVVEIFSRSRLTRTEHCRNSLRNNSITSSNYPQVATCRSVTPPANARRTRWIFDDLLALWLRLLQEHADVREHYQRRFQFISRGRIPGHEQAPERPD